LKYLETGISTIENARKHAIHEHHWTNRDGLDRCPDCSKKNDERVMEDMRQAMARSHAYLEQFVPDHDGEVDG
jgi:hypothetical protein